MEKEFRNKEFYNEDEKIETKGLKLRKNTKEKLNELQKEFQDAESMIIALLKEYNENKIMKDDKFIDRKAEIDKFNYLLDSIKGSYINSLEMATFAEARVLDAKGKEMKKMSILIESLQEEKVELKDKIKSTEKVMQEERKELQSVKDSFARVNMTLVTVEKELKEKAEIIQNNQQHINSLTVIAEEGIKYKDEAKKLKEHIKILEEKVNQLNILEERYQSEVEKVKEYKDVIQEQKKEMESLRKQNEDLNTKFQQLLMENSIVVNKLKDDNSKQLLELQEKIVSENRIANDVIYKLKGEILQLKVNNKVEFK